MDPRAGPLIRGCCVKVEPTHRLRSSPEGTASLAFPSHRNSIHARGTETPKHQVPHTVKGKVKLPL
jgi:hypothetical protein